MGWHRILATETNLSPGHEGVLAIISLQYRKSLHIANQVDNLMLTGNFNIKIIDFGFARRVVTTEGKKILSKTFCGTTSYCSPEIMEGIPYNPKLADNWSNGVIMYVFANG